MRQTKALAYTAYFHSFILAGCIPVRAAAWHATTAALARSQPFVTTSVRVPLACIGNKAVALCVSVCPGQAAPVLPSREKKKPTELADR